MHHVDDTLEVYRGASYKYACEAYWQAVNTLKFLQSTGKVVMTITQDRQIYGNFTTEIPEHGKPSLHVPSGYCIHWAYRQWNDLTLAEKIVATIPGMLRPVRYPRH